MKRTVLLLCAVGAMSALAGCVGYVPVHEPAPVAVYPAPVAVYPGPAVVYRGGPPARGMRDSDRDGVPNRYDRRPNNPYRY